MRKYEKILIVRTGAIGDVIHTSGLFGAIKKLHPDIKIHYLTSETIKPLLTENPDIEKVLTIDPKFKTFSAYTKKLAEEIKKENYDFVINLQPSFKIKWLIFLAGIKKSFNYKKDFKLHAVKNFWATGLKAFPDLPEINELKTFLPQQALKKAEVLLKDLPRPFVVISAGGVFSKRQGRTYPQDKWVEVGNKIVEKYGGTIILNGAKEDEEILAPLKEIKNSVNFIGKLPLVESCAIIAKADLMISGDSGPLHIATSLGVKSIGLFGSMPAKRTGCFCNGINLISKKNCVPCNKRKCRYLKGTKKLFAPCMEEISVNEILSAAETQTS